MSILRATLLSLVFVAGCASGGASLGEGGVASCTETTECDDGDPCNGVEACVTGVCTAGQAIDCDDGVSCTDDACNPDGTCTHSPNRSHCPGDQICDPVEDCVTPAPCLTDDECDDALFCNGVETCDPAIGCLPGTAPACNDAIECTTDTCDNAVGECMHTVDPAFCDDRLVCNGQETCDATGATPGRGCVAGTAIDCSDGVACTTDRCEEPAGTCSHGGSDEDGDTYIARGCGSGTDCNDLSATVHPGAAEVCDGVDNDCSGTADDGSGMQCALGSAPQDCTTTCGSAGRSACTAACTLAACVASTESCNGCDDDGDGVADDGLGCRRGTSIECTTSCGTLGNQACASDCSGYSVCVASAEVCGNACDDNRNGTADEGCAPANDTCASAYVISGSTGSRSDTFNGATANVTGCGSGADVWYRITLASRQILYLDTFGSSFDTSISLRTTCAGSAVQCEDDDCGTNQDVLVRDLGAGTYYIAVHAYAAITTSGTVALRWQTLTPGGDAVRVTANGSFSGSTTGASAAGGTCGGTGPEDLFYFTLCPSTTRTVGADTCTGATWDTVLYMRRGGDNVELACSDDACGAQSDVTAAATGPGLFGVFVDGYDGASGSYTVWFTGL